LQAERVLLLFIFSFFLKTAHQTTELHSKPPRNSICSCVTVPAAAGLAFRTFGAETCHVCNLCFAQLGENKQKSPFSCTKICVYKKNVLPLQPFSP